MLHDVVVNEVFKLLAHFDLEVNVSFEIVDTLVQFEDLLFVFFELLSLLFNLIDILLDV